MVTKQTYRLTCSSCGKSYQTDSKRGQRIAKLLQTNPNYLTDYKCRACSKGIVKTPTPKVVKTSKVVVEKKPVFETPNFVVEEDLKMFIPTSSEKYINRYFGKGKNRLMDEEIIKFHLNHSSPLMKNVLFIGDTGTGKTALIRYFCYKYKIPYYRVVMNGGTTVEDIIGQQVMDENGNFKFEFQVLIKFMQKGGIFVFDEINAGQKDILHILNSITDYERKAIVTQHKGEVIQAIDKFLVIACMNPPAEYELQEMSKSLKSRFTPYPFNYDDNVDKVVLNKDTKLMNFAKVVRTARLNGQIETPLSTRDLVQFQMIRDGLNFDVAKEVLITKFHNGEKQVIRTMIETTMEKSTILDQENQEDN